MKLTLCLLIGAALMSGCTANRKLKITEVGLKEVELYLDEPADHVLSLRDHKLRFMRSDGHTAEVELFGMLDGGAFLIVWEQQGYTGASVDEDYRNYNDEIVRGIKVPEGFFGPPQAGATYAYRVVGRNPRRRVLFIPTTDKTNDVVKFGPYDPMDALIPPRPDIGGAFGEDGSVPDDRTPRSLIKARTIARRWGSGGLQASDVEADWKDKNESFGRAN